MPERKGGRPKGLPKTGGKVKGSKNHATREREQRLIAALAEEQLTAEQVAELTPLTVMLRIMRARTAAGDDAGALIAAQAAAPYCHARLSSSDVHVTGTLATRSDAEVAAELLEIEAKLAAARVMN